LGISVLINPGQTLINTVETVNIKAKRNFFSWLLNIKIFLFYFKILKNEVFSLKHESVFLQPECFIQCNAPRMKKYEKEKFKLGLDVNLY